ncbi:MAG TPA: UDP-N-acetylmuramoyl-L-alanine--D-glutamate ligase [Allosphingosinicella sp.]|jgi:UDP-N-acetylmuramoylalanine--D-glutamate ligase|nr:UDP-N-acetylmuramoyl-L-alanine--D-glutamate ligase [Allosphingosinicella sp.]
MIASPAFRGKCYAVLGLARSGLATVEALAASGAEVKAWDNSESVRESFRSSRAKSRGADTDSEVRPSPTLGTSEVFIQDIMEIDLGGYDGVVVSPGVPLNTHPIAAKARAAGVPVIGDIELFAQARPSLPPHKVVGITGTNGKSTTTALVHHILKTAGIPTTMGGNIGLPILAQDPLPEGGVYVLELSSYQIDLTQSLDCDVAVLLNVTPDHLDRYEDFDAYRASKLRLFEMQSPTHVTVITDGPGTEPVFERLFRYSGRHYQMCNTICPDILGVTVFDGQASFQTNPIGFQSDWPTLQGPHNAENAAAAITVAVELDIPKATIAEALRTYPGLPHRMERVRERDGILFVNDSKATNTESTAPALAAYPYIHWIVGGRAKGEGLGPCADQLGHVRAAYTIGEAGPMFAQLLEGRVPVRRSEVLERAVSEAAGAAKSGEVVLLSPACASFDQFRDYEARGDAFRAMVGALP